RERWMRWYNSIADLLPIPIAYVHLPGHKNWLSDFFSRLTNVDCKTLEYEKEDDIMLCMAMCGPQPSKECSESMIAVAMASEDPPLSKVLDDLKKELIEMYPLDNKTQIGKRSLRELYNEAGADGVFYKEDGVLYKFCYVHGELCKCLVIPAGPAKTKL
ncbi:hypothetical protein FOL47_006186, partial [Perkinsus chesapeaki]